MHNNLTKLSKAFASHLAMVTIAAIALPAAAFQPLITDDTGTQGSGGNQLELSISEDRARTAGITDRTLTVPIGYTRGLIDSLDIFAGFGYARIRSGTPGGDASGGGNPSIGAKWRFYESEDGNTSFALKPELFLPVSAEREGAGLGTGEISGALTFILSQNVPFGSVHLNASVGRDRYRDALASPDVTTARASIAPVWDLSEQWKLALDLGTESARAGGSSVRANFVELGAIYSASKALDFAFGIVSSSDNASPRTTTRSAIAGITWRFQ